MLHILSVFVALGILHSMRLRHIAICDHTTGLYSPWGFQEVEAPRFQNTRHMKAVRLSALRTGRLYLPGNIPGTYFC